jgi:hypothetical protein
MDKRTKRIATTTVGCDAKVRRGTRKEKRDGAELWFDSAILARGGEV